RPACSVACREKRRPGARRPRGAEINGGRRWQAVCRLRRGPAAPRVSGETQGGRFGLPRPPPPTCAGERPLTGRYRRDQRLPAGRPAAVAAALSGTARRVRGECRAVRGRTLRATGRMPDDLSERRRGPGAGRLRGAAEPPVQEVADDLREPLGRGGVEPVAAAGERDDLDVGAGPG